MELKKIVVASGNKHKIEEIKQIFSDVEIISMKEMGFNEDIEENGKTFKENAYIKAYAVAKALNVPALSDDSGICVTALNDAPGIYSARYSGGNDADNRVLLLKNLEGATDRSARFECAICLCMPDGTAIYGEGRTHGEILFKDTGDHGFGYDCLFYSHDLNKSFGEASEVEKNGVSHRYRALCDLKSKL